MLLQLTWKCGHNSIKSLMQTITLPFNYLPQIAFLLFAPNFKVSCNLIVEVLSSLLPRLCSLYCRSKKGPGMHCMGVSANAQLSSPESGEFVHLGTPRFIIWDVTKCLQIAVVCTCWTLFSLVHLCTLRYSCLAITSRLVVSVGWGNGSGLATTCMFVHSNLDTSIGEYE